MTNRDRWLAASWRFVAAALPEAPARVLELGCGSAGGFVPRLLETGYDAVGVDPEAPAEPTYHRVEFERYDLDHPVDAVVASTSLHHVADLAEVLAKVAESLVPGGRLVVIEWDWERFDEATARWCFARLPPRGPEDDHNWLHHAQEEWASSGQTWSGYLHDWARQEDLHTGQQILSQLDAWFDCTALRRTPYIFSDLADVTEAVEQAAIDSGDIRATGIQYVGQGLPAHEWEA